MTLIGVGGAILTFSLENLLVFLVSSAIALCLGIHWACIVCLFIAVMRRRSGWSIGLCILGRW